MGLSESKISIYSEGQTLSNFLSIKRDIDSVLIEEIQFPHVPIKTGDFKAKRYSLVNERFIQLIINIFASTYKMAV